MKFSGPSPIRVNLALKLIGRMIVWRIFPLLLGILVSTTILRAQQPAAAADKQTLQLLLQRIDQLEARVQQLEAAKQQTAPISLPSAPVQTSSPQVSETELQTDNAVTERMDAGKTLLRMRGFGDITLHGDSQRHDTTAFSLGQLNLFITSDISEKFKFLSEIIFEGGPDNIFGETRGENNSFGVDVERMVLQYSRSDYFKLAVGRYHTAIGYYNTAYHHSTVNLF